MIVTAIYFLTSCNEKSPAEPSSKDEIYEVVNAVLQPFDTVPEAADSDKYILSDRLDEVKRYPGDSLGIHFYSDMFTKEDIAYIFKQANDTTAISLAGHIRVKKARLVSADSIAKIFDSPKLEVSWENFYKKYGHGFTSVSKPVFSVDHKTALITIAYHGGSLSGGGTLYILRKEKSGWVVKSGRMRWIS
ncbi:MAG TPA: hypothetical protein VEA37_08770 [Flavobacterium sp.]|nr:hypothetical protein [Flavobacterium sp.]